MIITSHLQSLPSEVFCHFLIQDIGLTREALDLGIRHSISENAPLPIILWNFGLITLEQYQTILDWINTNQ